MLMMFLINAFVSPLMWTINITYFYKKFRIYLIERKENPDEHHHKTQDELNELYELPTMDIFYKYSYIGNTLLMSFFYIPIFPLGVPISLLGFILGYFLEKFNFINMYKQPEMLNQNICFFYIENFKVILFCYSIGCFLFMNDVFPHNKWTTSNLIIFGLLCFIPYTKIFVCDLEVKQSQIQKRTYKENKENEENKKNKENKFLNEYISPIEAHEKLKKILDKLKNNIMINEEIYKEIINNKINGTKILNNYYDNFNKGQIEKEEENKIFEKKKTLYNEKIKKNDFDFNDEVSKFFGIKKKENNNIIISKKSSDIDYDYNNNNYNYLDFINLYNFENIPFDDDSQLNDVSIKFDNDENNNINNESSYLNNNDNNLVNDDKKIDCINSENYLINSDSNFNNNKTKNDNNLINLNTNTN